MAVMAAGLTVSAKHFAVYSEPKGGRDGAARKFKEMLAIHV